MSEHTKEPWVVGVSADNGLPCVDSTDSTQPIEICEVWGVVDDKVADETALANARRIVACVNACEGIPQDWLEFGSSGCLQNVREERNSYKQERDELLAALKRILPQYEALLRDCGLASEHATEQARAIIAKVEGAK